MSNLRTVLPIDATCIEWLDGEGIAHPQPVAAPRLPTPHEITEVLHQLSGYTASISADLTTGEWSAQVSAIGSPASAWAFLRIPQYRSDDQPHEFYFPKGWSEVVFAIVERLSHQCGPLVVADDSGSLPIVVSPGDSIADLLHRESVA